MSRARSVSVRRYLAEEWSFDPAVADPERDALVAMISRWAKPGEWLDLGCGPLLPVWPLFVEGHTKVTGLDRDAATTTFLRELDLQEAVPIAMAEAMAFAATRAGLMPKLPTIAEVVEGDARDDQPRWRSAFDTVTQIGCFGCMEHIDELVGAFDSAASYLRLDGRLISATWIPRSTHRESKRWGGRGALALHPQMIEDAIIASGLEMLETRILPGDEAYAEVALFAATRPRRRWAEREPS